MAISASGGPAYLVLVRIWEGTPTINSRIFKPEIATLITKSVEIGPGLDFLVMELPQ